MSAPAQYQKIRTLQLVAIVFFTVSGGPYGLEPLLSYAGEHAALLILLLTPLLWDIPAILTVLELNSMMPVTGGYYQWVKHALGERWGFFEGWWTWLYTFVDLAIYPVLFVEYAAYFFPQLAAFKIWVCLAVIWLSAGLNIRGIMQVGRLSLLLSVLVLVPFVVLFAVIIIHHTGAWAMADPGLKHVPFPSFSMALYTVMWNCLGWDNVTTYAREVDRPVRSYLISVAVAFTLVMVVYGLVIYFAQQSGIKPALLAGVGFPALGELTGGQWLGKLIAAGGMASTLGIYAAVLLSVSRVPQAMSNDKLLPAFLHRLHPRFRTPYVSILICSIIVSLMIMWTFGELLVIDVTVYGAGITLEYIALIKLRLHEPHRHRPFRVPLPVAGLIVMALLPLTVYTVALSGTFLSEGNGVRPALFAVGALLTAEIGWQLVKLVRRYSAS
jgi:amino acid transporter